MFLNIFSLKKYGKIVWLYRKTHYLCTRFRKGRVVDEMMKQLNLMNCQNYFQKKLEKFCQLEEML